MKLMAVLGLLALLGGAAYDLRKETVPQTEDYVLFIETGEHASSEEPLTVELATDDGLVVLPLEKYLVGVVLTEMPVSFEEEALKAQSVAARTFAMRAMENGKHEGYDLCSSSGCCQAWRSDSELRQVFGEEYEAYMEKGSTAVHETEGEVLTYDGQLIEAVYFSCSGGMSEPAVAVWGTDVPYLQAVQSPGEENASKFQSQVRVPFGEFQKTLKAAEEGVEFAVIPQDWIGEIEYSAGGGVARMELGGVTFTGVQLRKIFSLASTRFAVSVGDGEIVFSVKGYGHRVGMSQYGANAMALVGAEYAEILTHYYTGVSIKKLSRT